MTAREEQQRNAVRLRMADAIAAYFAAPYTDDEAWQWCYNRAYRWAVRHLERRGY
jgi:hypothetical protein